MGKANTTQNLVTRNLIALVIVGSFACATSEAAAQILSPDSLTAVAKRDGIEEAKKKANKFLFYGFAGGLALGVTPHLMMGSDDDTSASAVGGAGVAILLASLFVAGKPARDKPHNSVHSQASTYVAEFTRSYEREFLRRRRVNTIKGMVFGAVVGLVVSFGGFSAE